MQQVDAAGQLDLAPRRSAGKRYVDTFFRHWLIVLIPILVLPVVALGVTRLTKGGVTVTTNIYVSQGSIQGIGYVDPQATPATNAQAALQQLLQTTSFDVAAAKGSPLYWSTVASKPDPNYQATSDLSKNVKILPNGPNLLGISYSTKLPAAGLQLLQSILKQAPHELARLAQQQAAVSVSYYSKQEKRAQAGLARATQQLGTYVQQHNIPSSAMATQALFDPRFAALYQAVQSDQVDVHNIQQQVSQATTLESAGNPIQVIDAPSMSVSSTSKKTLLLDFGIGLIVGLLLSGIFIVVTTVRDHSLRYAAEVQDLLGLPVLSTLPHSERLARGAGASALPAPRTLRRTDGGSAG